VPDLRGSQNNRGDKKRRVFDGFSGGKEATVRMSPNLGGMLCRNDRRTGERRCGDRRLQEAAGYENGCLRGRNKTRPGVEA